MNFKIADGSDIEQAKSDTNNQTGNEINPYSSVRRITWKQCQLCKINDRIESIILRGSNILRESTADPVALKTSNKDSDEPTHISSRSKSWQKFSLSAIAIMVVLCQMAILIAIL
ncbi:hypothetical protein TrispH2_005808 [Trichoplax sp. H2]|nr:hypothetical protein TrispH2_005808 [Trichoplax sp. H2]|eukprot:RDD41906.1 hypothetical protein TrispH2_005808 [Trichoplax sp. H2]